MDNELPNNTRTLAATFSVFVSTCQPPYHGANVALALQQLHQALLVHRLSPGKKTKDRPNGNGRPQRCISWQLSWAVTKPDLVRTELA